MRDKLLFIAKFLAFSAIIFIIWIFIGRYYLILVAYASKFILALMGYDTTLLINEEIYFICRGSEVGLTHSELANYNIVPFLALVFATPIGVHRMGKVLSIGLPIIFLFHVIDLVAHFPFYYEGSSFARMIISLPAVTRMVIPFLLWFALTYDYVLRSFRKERRKYRCPICGEVKVGITEHIKAVHGNLDERERKKIKKFLDKYPELRASN